MKEQGAVLQARTTKFRLEALYFSSRLFRQNFDSFRLYGGHSLRSRIEAPLISREVVPETYFLLVIMAADALEGRAIFAVSSIMLMWNLVKI